ncbi:MAG: nitronate monooxygenase family protein [Planctomycetes bacterium]|nr:nitronate monooxygenase family protein [Planctomycetota bacterium]MBU1518771.1 nitronate monooxygenase family protein [Planctomycetota bacterium]MBU2457586.1 nitronate monooxygenase family protein [Planctomycetota bacterium]MBU2597481.1 nitronate monooxygenase family protein [Planctomycetota bacterium]
MSKKIVPSLKIGNLEIYPPIIQGGMGIRVSEAGLASAVANTGCAGVIASTGIGLFEDLRGGDLWAFNSESLRKEIQKARSLSKGIIGINIMVALTDYENLVKVSVEENVDMIIAGAGLPLDLPKFLNGKDVKLVPIVSSAKALALICKRWKKRYDKLPDAVVVEGIKAGGHLGYSAESLADGSAMTLEQIVEEVVALANSFEPKIPVIAAGGIFDGADIARFLKLGACGVQMATRFVCTDECDAHQNFKQAYLDAGPDDTTIIKSPVGLPGRVINSPFVEKIKHGLTMPFNCVYKCLRTCDPDKAPYCIAQVLSNASKGKLDESFVFAGSNAYKCTEIIPVKVLVEKLIEELRQALSAEKRCPITK